MIQGTLIEAGDISDSEGKPIRGLIVECTKEQLQAAKIIPLYRKVTVSEPIKPSAADIHEIRKTMDRAVSALEGSDWHLAEALEKAEKEIEEAVGEYWTQASELAEALEDILNQDIDCPLFKLKDASATLAKWKEANHE